jgi:signal transduction histidine kinase
MGFLFEDSENVVFYVKDTGIGIAPENIRSIFKGFRKIEVNSAKIYRGAGLGLSITKKLVELLGGKIWVESELGKGSTFFFSLPHSNHL